MCDRLGYFVMFQVCFVLCLHSGNSVGTKFRNLLRSSKRSRDSRLGSTTESPEVVNENGEDPQCPKSRLMRTMFSGRPLPTTKVFNIGVQVRTWDKNTTNVDYLSTCVNYNVLPLHNDYSDIYIFITGMGESTVGFNYTINRLQRVKKRAAFLTIAGFHKWIPLYSYHKNRVSAVAEFVYHLLNMHFVNHPILIEKTHIIGFSLGAHVAGIVGHKFNGRIPRITGLDPAKPGFEWLESSSRLDKSSALFVDVIHTDTCRFGVERSLGHIDFYPDGGQNSPDLCRNTWDPFCNHKSAMTLFDDSIRPEYNQQYNHRARECSSWKMYVNHLCVSKETNTFGYRARKPVLNGPLDHKKYYLYTNKAKQAEMDHLD